MFGYVTSCFDRYRNKTEREREKWMLNLKQNILVCDSRENFFSFCFERWTTSEARLLKTFDYNHT